MISTTSMATIASVRPYFSRSCGAAGGEGVWAAGKATRLRHWQHPRLRPTRLRRLQPTLGFSFRSLSAAQSSGASEGTDVTTPVPLPIEIVMSGSV